MPNLVQHRQALSARIGAAYRKSPAEASRVLAEAMLPLLSEKLIEAVKRDEGWAICKGFEIAKMAGAQPQILVAFMSALGVRDEADAARRIDWTREAEALTEDDRLELAEDLVLEAWRREPERMATSRLAEQLRLAGAV